MKGSEVVQINLRTKQRTIAELDKYARKMDLSRNKLIENLLIVGVDDLKTMDRLGLIRLGCGVRDLVERARQPNPKQGMLFHKP